MKPQPDSNQDNPDAVPVRSPQSRTAIPFARKKCKKMGRNSKAAQKKLQILRLPRPISSEPDRHNIRSEH
ncbi:hypothetical protein RchiOBHm_Chr7g0185071 [Rosa chinensis]|uniref:Uncharacterized protein n=1 Tax=Rosa chinensis TaxID=74649 RepID=A0A2P6P3K3_ROSCH|nr:hypothetical protein RchiOBHm_Chr7g0185071 [Rosa chinensis]